MLFRSHTLSSSYPEPRVLNIFQLSSSRQRPIVLPYGPHQTLRRHRRPENSPLSSPSNPNQALSFGLSPLDESPSPRRPGLAPVTEESAVHRLVSPCKLQDESMTAAQQQQEGIEYLWRDINNTYEYIENIPNRLSIMSNPNAPQRPEDIGTVFEWPAEGTMVTEDLQPESKIGRAHV